MWKAALVGVVALMTINTSLAVADTSVRPASVSETVINQAQVARLKAMLKLSAAQEQLWPAVEAAFRRVSQQQAESGEAQGLRSRALAIGVNAMALRQLASAASPLIQTLTPEQKESAVAFARSLGLTTLAAAL